jgi:hypothetical protein
MGLRHPTHEESTTIASDLKNLLASTNIAMEEELLKSRDRVRAIVDTAVDGIITMQTVSWNKRQETGEKGHFVSGAVPEHQKSGPTKSNASGQESREN